MSYTKAELIEYVSSVAKNVYETGCDESHVDCVDIRLQLFKGYHIWTGDVSYDTDHRGFWGSSELVIRDDDGEVYTYDDYIEFATEIVEQALDHLHEYVYNLNLQQLKGFAEENNITKDDMTKYRYLDTNTEEGLSSVIVSEITNGGKLDVFYSMPLATIRVEDLSKELEYTNLSQDISGVLENIGITDNDNEIGSLWYDYCDGDIGEVWYTEESVPYLSNVAKKIRE